MKFRDFAYWLQGFFEVQEPTQLTQKQVNIIKAHLDSCFKPEVRQQFFGTCGTGGKTKIKPLTVKLK